MALVQFKIGGSAVATFERPTNGTASTAFFVTSLPGLKPPNERLQRLTFPAINGQAAKKMGADAWVAEQRGWVEGSSFASLVGAINTLAALSKAQTAGTLLLLDGAKSLTEVIMTKLNFPRVWGYGGRYCADYEITWEQLGGE